MPTLKLIFSKLRNWYWLVLVAVVFNSWFLQFGVRTAGDWGYFVKAASDTLRRHYFTIWLSDTQFGRVLIDAGQAPTYAAYGFLSYYLHTSYALNERLVHLWPSVIVTLISSFLLARHIFADKSAAVLSAIVYSANTYFLALLTGGLTLSGAYAFAPAVILTYIKYLENYDKKQAIYCALLMAVCGAYEPRVAYIVAFSLLLYAFVHLTVETPNKRDKWLMVAMRELPKLSIPFIIFFFLNVYWLLGLAMAGGSSASTVIASSLFGNEFFRLPEALTLHHPFWTGGQIQPFFAHAIPIYFWLIPVAAIGGVVVARKSAITLFFAFLGIFGILLTKQSDEPFKSLYGWLFSNLPGFNAFREASKFYILTALSYSILIPSVYVYFKKRYRSKWIYSGIFAGLALLFIPNLIPVATNKIGGTFSNKSIPPGYEKLNDALAAIPPGRILWVPQKSRWSYSDVNHPAVSASQLVNVSWSTLQGAFDQNNNATTTDEINTLLSQNYTGKLLAAGNIRYVIVPLRDTQNSDNFYRNYNDDPSIFATTLARQSYLKPASIHIPGFTIFETVHSPEPYISSTDKIYSIDTPKDLSAAYSLIPQTTKDAKDFDFVTTTKRDAYVNTFTDAYDGLTTITPDQKSVVASLNATRKNYLYTPLPYTSLSYQFRNKSLVFNAQNTDIASSRSPVSNTAAVIAVAANKPYVVDLGDSVRDVSTKPGTHYLGTPRKDSTVYAVESDNLIPHSGAKNPWDIKLQNCAAYGSEKPNIAMQINSPKQFQQSSVSLTAQDHAACAKLPPIKVKPLSKYLLSFEYEGENAQLAGYYVEYGTGRNDIHEDIALSDSQWHGQQRVLTVPQGATTLTVSFVGRPTNQLTQTAVSSYRAFSLRELGTATSIYRTSDAPKPEITDGAVSIKQPLYAYKNLIQNGDLAKGQWHKKVDDCDKYNAYPELKMSLLKSGGPGGTNAISLGARNHIACTSTPNVAVQASTTYLLQFAYQSSNAKNAYYSLDMNDALNTTVEESIPIKDHKWHTYSKLITVPSGANRLRLTVSANSDDGHIEYLTNNYAQFRLVNVPDLQQRAYNITPAKTTLQKPTAISYRSLGSTAKQITIKGAKKPFVLVMHEQYHPGWKLLPLSVPTADNYKPWHQAKYAIKADHFELNGFANAWYIDPVALCAQQQTVCKNMSGGAYDITLTARFLPQAWFNLGMLISGATLVGCGLTLVFLYVISKKEPKVRRHI
jgi:hypothetical protein